ncbi:hypothetical protein TXYLGN1_02120 [Tepidimicrobium xylanilyticum]|uniref:Uncharacterized protein n=1 Tax=Tepidimicrobium xylanilyticum TaxID=1123352 RepID=A0A1H3C0G2_9FIRM|nr:hypothetical protein SAMN05660923_02381 [Tepidimicrobium xylanilyticum]
MKFLCMNIYIIRLKIYDEKRELNQNREIIEYKFEIMKLNN